MVSPAERNEQTVRSLFEEVINGKRYDRIAHFCAPDVEMNRPGGRVRVGRDDYERHYRKLHTAFPDMEANLTDVVADETRVATRFVVTGTHDGELFGTAPTGKTVRFPAQVLFRFDDGAIVEEFHQSDRLVLRDQIEE